MNGYPTYKPIDLPWLLEIPAHWSVLRNKNIFCEVKDTVGSDSASYTLLSLTLKGIIPRDIESGKGKFPKDFDTYKIVKAGNMAFCLFDVDETPRTVGLSAYNGMLTGAYTIFQVRNVNPRYVFYYYLVLDNIKALRPLYSGLRKTINVGTFLGTKLPLPPCEEQDQIVRFLDWKVSAINHLINIRKKQIGKLYELKNSLVHQVITKGLDSESNTNESGYEWVGSMPHHWKVVSLRRVYSVILGKMLSPNPSNENCSYEEYICAKDVHFDDVDLSNLKRMWFSESEKEQYQVQIDDLLVVEGGAGAGNAAIVKNLQDRQIYVQNSIHIIRPKDKQALNSFLCFWIQSLVARGYMKNICSVATIPHFTKDKVLSTMMPLPPIREQEKIVAFLNNQFAKIAKIIDLKNTQIRQLEEYKARLISDVVTGKIDVRNIEIPEYEYMSEDVDTESETAEQEDNFYE